MCESFDHKQRPFEGAATEGGRINFQPWSEGQTGPANQWHHSDGSGDGGLPSHIDFSTSPDIYAAYKSGGEHDTGSQHETHSCCGGGGCHHCGGQQSTGDNPIPSTWGGTGNGGTGNGMGDGGTGAGAGDGGTGAGAGDGGAGAGGAGAGAGDGGTGAGTGDGGAPPTVGTINGVFQADTWNPGNGYTISGQPNDGTTTDSFSAVMNSDGPNGVRGYPDIKFTLESQTPADLTSSWNITPPANSQNLHYEYAYDIWLTTPGQAEAGQYNWNSSTPNREELMIWTYNNGETPAGQQVGTLSDGTQIWSNGSSTNGTVSLVLPNATSGTVNISNDIKELEADGYISPSYTGILDAEYGIEAPYGGGQTFNVNSVTMSD